MPPISDKGYVDVRHVASGGEVFNNDVSAFEVQSLTPVQAKRPVEEPISRQRFSIFRE